MLDVRLCLCFTYRYFHSFLPAGENLFLSIKCENISFDRIVNRRIVWIICLGMFFRTYPESVSAVNVPARIFSEHFLEIWFVVIYFSFVIIEHHVLFAFEIEFNYSRTEINRNIQLHEIVFNAYAFSESCIIFDIIR